ncbi:alpha/beta hydrolase [Hymenobacter koreensis]|uniref:Alpha/beta hydrolase n=1 Tax=Hymenobacter koreensis TaxID=1084523 RepID=A0ABP8IY34_9BACT
MKKWYSLLVTLACARLLAAQSHFTMPLYQGTVPNSKPSDVTETVVTLPNGGTRISNVVQPTLTVFRAPPDKANGTGIIVCPGGGYVRLAIDNEGAGIAQRFNAMGVTVFMLKYRLPNDQSQPDKTIAPLLDVQQALRLVRQQAAQFGVNPARLGVMGFSAGGHLAATAGTHFAKPAGSPGSNASVRPDFLVLVYPLISFTDSLVHASSRTALLGAAPTLEQIRFYSGEQQVSAQTPPTFLVHAADDPTVKVQNSLRFYEACLRHGVSAEMHLYPKGGHGFGLHNKTTKDDWTGRLHNWFDSNGWLTP